MRNVLGALLFLAAAGFLVHAVLLRRRVLTVVGADGLARRRAAALSDPRSLAAFGEIAQPLVRLGLGWLALKSTFAYVALDGARVLSWFDVAGFLAALLAYGTWFSIRTRYWLPDEVANAATLTQDSSAAPASTAGPASAGSIAMPQPADAEQRTARRAA